MKAFFTISVYLLVFLLVSCSNEPKEETKNAFSDPLLRAVYHAADKRDIEALLVFSNHNTAAYRMAFARTMASVLDSSAKPALYDLLKDPVPYVRMYAAFAVGQYADTSSLPYLEKTLKKATIPEIKAEILIAVGKSANQQAMDYLIFHEPSTAMEETGKMNGIYFAMLRGLLKEDHLRTVAAHLQSQERDTRLAALHTLSRQKIYSLDDYSDNLLEALDSENGEERALAFRALRKTSAGRAEAEDAFRSDPDPRVRVEAFLKLMDSSQEFIPAGLEDGSPWVAMTAAGLLANEPDANIPSNMYSLALSSEIPEVRAAIVISLLKNDFTFAQGLDLWQRGREAHRADTIGMATYYLGLHHIPQMIDSIKAVALYNGPKGTAATEALISGGRKHFEWKNAFYEFAKKSLEQGLPAQSYLYAVALQEPFYTDTSVISVALLNKALQNFQGPGKVETRNEIRRAIAVMSGGNYRPETISYNHPVDWDLVQEIDQNTKATIYSEGNALEIDLLVEDAPATVANFVTLAETGYFDGTYFHRVVPNFVSQGGGERGDGFGSPGYTLRSEFSPLNFGPGVIGMASAGKDTEGSQFFITHLSTPHLNGRYTIFAAVSSNFDALTAIKTGSKIDSIIVHR